MTIQSKLDVLDDIALNYGFQVNSVSDIKNIIDLVKGNLSLESFSKQIRISHQRLQSWYDGVVIPSKRSLLAILKYYELNKPKEWSRREIKYLVNSWYLYTVKDLAKQLKRSEEDVRNKIKSLDLYKEECNV